MSAKEADVMAELSVLPHPAMRLPERIIVAISPTSHDRSRNDRRATETAACTR